MNIMLNHWTNSGRVIKLIDFGGAMYISQCSRNAVLQTRPYRAPEVLVGKYIVQTMTHRPRCDSQPRT